MPILRSSQTSSNQSPDGFSWNIRISEKVLVTMLMIGSSFSTGFVCGRTQTVSQAPALPLSKSAAVPSTSVQPTACVSACQLEGKVTKVLPSAK